MSKVIMHIDLNAFFANVEIINDPSLKNKPLIVAGSGRRGIVSTASYEARKFGVRSGMPTYMAKNLCPEVIIKPVNFKIYNTYSRMFFGFIATYSPIIEVASIDECYVDMTIILAKHPSPMQYLKDLQQELLKKTKLPCSIGIGPTKFLAKMASDFKKPMGITIFRRRDLQNTLWKLPIKDMWGVGKKTYPRLEALGIRTIGDLATNTNEVVKQSLGKFYTTLIQWANGQGSDEVNIEETDNKSIGSSSTMLIDTNSDDELRGLLLMLAKEVSRRAKNASMVGQTVQIVIKNADFTSITRSHTFNTPTNEASVIYDIAVKLFYKNYKNQMVRLLGVTLQKLASNDHLTTQMSLFDTTNTKRSKTELLIDDFNKQLKKPILTKLSDLKKAEDK